MILWVFIEFFKVKIVIGLSKNHYDLILIVEFDLSQNILFVKVFAFLFPNEVSLEIKMLVQTSNNQRSKSKKWPNSKSNKQ